MESFSDVAMAADDVVGGLPVADIAFADQGIIGPINDDNPPSYKVISYGEILWNYLS